MPASEREPPLAGAGVIRTSDFKVVGAQEYDLDPLITYSAGLFLQKSPLAY
jgi:hypothetical protein